MPDIASLLIVEDDPDWLQIYATNLRADEYTITEARTLTDASNLVSDHEFTVVATDLKLFQAATGGLDILEIVKRENPDTQVIIFTGAGDKDDAYEAMRHGAYTYITKPLNFEHVKQVVKSAIIEREQNISKRRSGSYLTLPFPEKFVGSSAIIKDMFEQVSAIINSTTPTLIWGAPGTGKALIAETIQRGSEQGPFRLVNCGSFSETTLERILFGYARDPSIGVMEDESGLLEEASGGTLILDEVSSLSPRLQNELASSLPHGRVKKVGGTQATDISVRILATAPVDLSIYVNQGLFSEELYAYLSQAVVALPPLKARKDDQTDDVTLLAGYFLDKYKNIRQDHKPLDISNSAKRLLETYDFPGNVRELEDAIRIAIMRTDSGTIEPHHLPEKIQNDNHTQKTFTASRGPLSESVFCPHGYSLTAMSDLIAQAYDSENHVYLSVGDSRPIWYMVCLKEILAAYRMKLYELPDPIDKKTDCPLCRAILSCSVAIFDFTTRDPLTFYELGLAQATGLRCLVLAKGEPNPLDDETLPISTYTDSTSLQSVVANWLNELSSTGFS